MLFDFKPFVFLIAATETPYFDAIIESASPDLILCVIVFGTVRFH
jgi:hypothetical protein